jgi:hypothetical protein
VPGFQAVDGSGGDGGNDGFLVSGETVFQAYGPRKPNASRTRQKIVDSLNKAAVLRDTKLPCLANLCFVTPFDLTPDLSLFLLKAGAARGLAVESWGRAKLLGLLARAPDARTLFGELLMPDVFGEIRALRQEVASFGSGTALPYESPEHVISEILGPDFDPDIFVLQKNEVPGRDPRRAFEFFRIRVYAPVLRHAPFEPSEEAAFVESVRSNFLDDVTATLEAPSSSSVSVEHRHLDLAFHRRWQWWCGGAVGMAATLPDLHRPGHYSAADVAVDCVRLLKLACDLGRPQAHARIVFEFDPYQHAVLWTPSDSRARERLGARLEGVQSVARPKLDRSKPYRDVFETTMKELSATYDQVASKLLVGAMRDLHGARIDTATLHRSVLSVSDIMKRAASL